MSDAEQPSSLIPSPLATGGAGDRFEQRLDAYALALLLVGATSPVLLDSTVVEVHLQTRHRGWQTDDLLIVGQVRPGITRRLAVQAKRSFTIAASDPDCVQTIVGMWDDFNASERFDPSVDRLAVGTLHGTTRLLADFRTLLDCARSSPSAVEFERRVRLDGYLSKVARGQHETLLQILQDHVGDQVDPEVYWRFLRIVTVLSVDLGTATAHTESLILTLLAHTTTGGDRTASASATWARLLDVAGEGRQNAASYRREQLPLDILALHGQVVESDKRAFARLVDHGRAVRGGIRSTIGGHMLDRSAHAGNLLQTIESNPVVVVAGAAGTGKSSLVRGLVDRLEAERPVLAFQAVEFATPHLNDTLLRTQAGIDGMALRALLVSHDRTIIMVDGLERLLEHSVRDAFAHLVRMVGEVPSLRLVVTCRDYSVETVRSSLLIALGGEHRLFELGPASDDELKVIGEALPDLEPLLADHRMRELLRTPYMLDIASRLDWSSGTPPLNLRAFREKCWHEVVRDDAHPADGMNRRRERLFLDVARRRATELRPFIALDVKDPGALERLVQASLVERSTESAELLAPAHDVLEDWAILRWLDDVAAAADDRATALAEAVGGFPSIRRGLRRWLGERLELEPNATRDFVLDVTQRLDLPEYFRDDCVVSALLSPEADSFIAGCRERIASGDMVLLTRLIHLLRVACKKAPLWLPVGGLPSTLLIPDGPAWAPVLELVDHILPQINHERALLVLGLVEDWARQVTVFAPTASGADAAGRIVTRLLELFDGYSFDDLRKRALEVAFKIPTQTAAFTELAQRVLSDPKDASAREFADSLLSTLGSPLACRDAPDTVIDVLRARLMIRADDLRRERWSLDIGEYFGIRDRGPSDFFPASAIQGPFWPLLRHYPRKAVSVIIELLNHGGEWYAVDRSGRDHLEPAFRITLDVPGVGPVEQWMNGRLFALYRGMTVGPYSLQSALMALEKWLLESAAREQFDLDAWLLHIISKSNNVMATAVAASVAVAYPERAGRAALALLSSRDLIQCDKQRLAAESSASVEFLAGLNPSHEIYENERRESNGLGHRHEDLESLALRLQLTDRRENVWALIDRHRVELPDDTDEETLVWRLALHRMDVRGFRRAEAPPAGTESAPGGEDRVYLVPGQIEPEVQELVESASQRMALVNRHLHVRNQAHAIWTNRTDSQAAEWRALLQEAVGLADEGDPPEAYLGGGPGIVAAVSIRDHLAELTKDELLWCAGRVRHELMTELVDVDSLTRRSRGFGSDRAAAAVAGLLVAVAPHAIAGDPRELLVHALGHPTDEVSDYAYAGIGVFVRSSAHRELVLRCAASAIAEARVREAHWAADRTRGDFGEMPRQEPTTEIRVALRQVLTGDVGEVGHLLDKFALDGWWARRAALRVSKVLGSWPEWSEARAFYSRIAAWLAEMWSERRRSRSTGERDFHAEYDLRRQVARFALRLPPAQALEVCAPLISTVRTETREPADFVHDLILETDGKADDSFWPIWQAFADAAAAAPWAARLTRDEPYEVSLINRLFLVTHWKREVKHWDRLDGNAERVHSLATRLPAGPAVAEAYGRFLYTIGSRSLPTAFLVVDEMFSRGDAPRIASKQETAFCLESLLGRFVYGQPHRLKREPKLRSAVLRLLDALVGAGSSSAYRMRDDFVTPLRAGAA